MIVLKKRSEFVRLRKGRRQVTRGFILQAIDRTEEESFKKVLTTSEVQKVIADEMPRFGFTVSKKVGNAVARNRVKRRLRALVREVALPMAKKNTDYGIIGRKAALRLPFFVLRKDIVRAFDRIHSDK